MKLLIYVTTEFVGFHCWPEAPDKVFFLRDVHRHIFKVRVTCMVEESRELEFFTVKELLQDQCSVISERMVPENACPWSCEDIVCQLHIKLTEHKITVITIDVSEDGENGAIGLF